MRHFLVICCSYLVMILPWMGCAPGAVPPMESHSGTPANIPPPTAIGENAKPVESFNAATKKHSINEAVPVAQVTTAKPAAATAKDNQAGDTLVDIGTRKKGVDWPFFLGPNGDSKSTETGIIKPWPEEGPRIVWQRELGISYDIGAISKGRYYQFDRFDDRRANDFERTGRARLSCLNAETGAEIWNFEYPTAYEDLYGYNGGPRCSPIVDGNRVYIFGVEGMLHCLNATSGELIWKLDTNKEFGVIQNFFGVGSTPVIDGDLLIVMVGGSPPESQDVPPGQLDRVTPNGTGIVAFNKFTGEVKYKIADELASYASLKLATIDDRRWCFAFMRAGLSGFEPSTGKIDFFYPWRARSLESVNASMPVVVGNEVFISETYGIGSSLLTVKPGDHEIVWNDDARKRDKSMKCHWNTPVYVDGYLYGCSGRNPPDAELRCIEWKTGEVMWSVPNKIRTSLLYVDGHFVCLGEYGLLQLIKADPQKLDVVSEVTLRRKDIGPTIPGAEPKPLLKYPCWAAPVLSHGLLYVRGEERLVCLELIP